jgi:predicted DNA-binding transcriptional regulator AlpA
MQETQAASNATELLRPRAAAAYLGISYAHLRVLSRRGEGPRSVRLGHRCLYLRDTLKNYLLEKEQASK